ncbi:MAG TPA: hypothetical protein VI873_00780, partial [Candidatus Peribacteraceae bacterium]|nr:hypothetical protein [Candidatus Peribacteraceae bacterium]
MDLQKILIGIVATVVVLFFLVLGLRSCTRESDETGSATSGGDAGSSIGSLTSCTADPDTGLCFPKEKKQAEPFDWTEFMATVREHQRSSSSSSSRAPFFRLSDSFLQRFRRSSRSSSRSKTASSLASRSPSAGADDEVGSSSPRSSLTTSSPSSGLDAQGDAGLRAVTENFDGSATAKVIIIGMDDGDGDGGDGISGDGSPGSRSFTSRSFSSRSFSSRSFSSRSFSSRSFGGGGGA